MFDELGRSAEAILSSLLSDIDPWRDGKEAEEPMTPPRGTGPCACGGHTPRSPPPGGRDAAGAGGAVGTAGPPHRGAGPVSRGLGVRPSRGQTTAGEGPEVAVRMLVGESPPLAQAQAPRVAAGPQAARAALATLQPPWPRRTFACEADAHQAATLGRRERSLPRHPLTDTVGCEWVPHTRATRGRPPRRRHAPSARVGA